MPRFDKWLGDLGPDAPVSRAARQAVKVRLEAVEYFFGRAVRKPRQGRVDAEAVHQLRIWTRRAAAALRLFEDFLPKRQARWLKRKLREVRRAGGAARDCDVLLARLPTHSDDSLANLVHQIQSRREAASRKLLKMHERLIAGKKLRRHAGKLLKKAARHTKTKAAAQPYAAWCRKQLAPMAGKFFRLSESDLHHNQTLHELRIAGKHLRYALELATAALTPKVREKLYEGLSDLQDRLGIVCDSLASVDRLREWIEETHDSAVHKHLRKALTRERAELALQKRLFLKWWTVSRRKALQRLWTRALGKN